MGCGESKHATATANTAITKRSSSSRTNSQKERPPLDQQPETPANNDATKNPPQSAPQKGDNNIIHIIKESKGGDEKALEAKESKNGAKETIIDKTAKVEEKENGAQASKEGSLEQNEDVNTNEEYSCF
ncbi:PREDICTED: uncharacterized protein LOC109174999 [Ipomoea nil]|uniref:uncharacterized protein LOC109174999 n=1 Tax=Ipomoea nil TaxID=35883 RepID=UPI00090146D0|nr:PREDICTED: uncharacterized protein LOC109174999 [Ipomoea nil]XP_019179803.1 PREDICTED: uncharacterized protein LOC109174999 [Ipomoea nil]